MDRQPESSADRNGVGEGADWPYASLMLFGFFGTDTPEGKRLAWRTAAALVLFVVSALGLADGFHSPFPDVLWVLGLPGSVLAIGWAYGRYLGALDELNRTIQLKAFVFAYGAAMTLMAIGVTVALIAPTSASPKRLLLLPVFAELFRGVALAVLARRYR